MPIRRAARSLAVVPLALTFCLPLGFGADRNVRFWVKRTSASVRFAPGAEVSRLPESGPSSRLSVSGRTRLMTDAEHVRFGRLLVVLLRRYSRTLFAKSLEIASPWMPSARFIGVLLTDLILRIISASAITEWDSSASTLVTTLSITSVNPKRRAD